MPSKTASNAGPAITDAAVICVDKCQQPSKHYVYIISVTRCDGQSYTICRRYRHFIKLHSKLLSKFPEEGDTENSYARIIPFLPGEVMFGRSAVRKVVHQRRPLLDVYCKALICLPVNISQHPAVILFFSHDDGDVWNVDENENSLSDTLNISGPVFFDEYRVIQNFDKVDTRELSVSADDMVELIYEDKSGWCYVRNKTGITGWIPLAFLEVIEPVMEDRVSRHKHTDTPSCMAVPELTTTKKQTMPERHNAMSALTDIPHLSTSGENGCIIEDIEHGGKLNKTVLFEPLFLDEYRAVGDFTAIEENEMNIKSGEILQLLQKHASDWWYVRSDCGSAGWVPRDYLQKVETIFVAPPRRKKSVKLVSKTESEISAVQLVMETSSWSLVPTR